MKNLLSRLLNCLRVCTLTIVFTLLITILIVPNAQARRTRTAPPPETSPVEGQEQSVEGLFNIIKFSEVSFGSVPEINLDSPFTVNNLDGKPKAPNMVGEGSLLEIVQAAGRVWDAAFPQQTEIFDEINLGVAWADFSLNEELLDCQSEKVAISSNGLDPEGIVAVYIHAGEKYPDAEGTLPDSDLDGVIIFNSQPIEADLNGDSEKERILLYLDDNPFKSKIFGSLQQVTSRNLQDDRGNSVNFGRSIFKRPEDFNSSLKLKNKVRKGDLVIDAFTVALHELEHSLGVSTANPDALKRDILIDLDPKNSPNRLVIGNSDDKITIPTTVIDTQQKMLLKEKISLLPGSMHIFDNLDGYFNDFDAPESNGIGSVTATIFGQQIATPVGFEFVTNSERKCPSEADVLAVAKINGFKNPMLDPCQTLLEQKSPQSAY